MRVGMQAVFGGVIATILLASPGTRSEDYPSRPVRIVVASVPGSAPDVLARMLAERMTASFRQQVIVENRAGAGGIIGVDAVAKAPADGYTLVIGHDGTMAFSTVLHRKLPYDPIRDFAPVTLLALNEFVLVASASVPVSTLAKVVAYARYRGGQASYASAGVGTPNQLIMEQLAEAAGFAMVHVPYKGGAAAVADVVGGQVPFMMAGLAPALPHIRSGKLRAIAVPQVQRAAALPDTPTLAQSIPGFSAKTWFGLFAPGATRGEVIARLNREVRAVLESAAMKQALSQQGMVVETSEPGALGDLVRADIARYRILAQRLRIEPE